MLLDILKGIQESSASSPSPVYNPELSKAGFLPSSSMLEKESLQAPLAVDSSMVSLIEGRFSKTTVRIEQDGM